MRRCTSDASSRIWTEMWGPSTYPPSTTTSWPPMTSHHENLVTNRRQTEEGPRWIESFLVKNSFSSKDSVKILGLNNVLVYITLFRSMSAINAVVVFELWPLYCYLYIVMVSNYVSIAPSLDFFYFKQYYVLAWKKNRYMLTVSFTQNLTTEKKSPPKQRRQLPPLPHM